MFVLTQFHALFVTGGSSEKENQSRATDTNMKFDPKTDTWKTMQTRLPSAIPEESGARFRHGAFAL